MVTIRQQLWTYLKLILKSWYVRAVFVVEFITIIAILALPHLEIPPLVAWALAFLGLFWAGFEVYREMLAELANQWC